MVDKDISQQNILHVNSSWILLLEDSKYRTHLNMNEATHRREVMGTPQKMVSHDLLDGYIVIYFTVI